MAGDIQTKEDRANWRGRMNPGLGRRKEFKVRHLPSQRASAWDLLGVVSCGDAFTLEQLGPLFDLSVEELRPAVEWLCERGLLARLELLGSSWFLVTMRGHLLLDSDSPEESPPERGSGPALVKR